MSSSLIFSLREAYVSFGKKEIFNNLDINIHQGDRIALIGKNGVGCRVRRRPPGRLDFNPQ